VFGAAIVAVMLAFAEAADGQIIPAPKAADATARPEPRPPQAPAGGRQSVQSVQSLPIGQLPGIISFGLTGGSHLGSQLAAAADGAGRINRRTQMSVSFRRGPRQEIASLFQQVPSESRFRADIRHLRWTLAIGELSLPSGTLNGPAARGNGASFERRRGSVIAGVLAARPNAFGQTQAGRLIRIHAGLRNAFGTVSAIALDRMHPARSSNTSGFVGIATLGQVVSEASQIHGAGVERQLQPADLQSAVERLSASTRVRSAGLEADLRPGGVHRLLLRTGGLWLANASAQQSRGAAAEARYAFSAERAFIDTRIRHTPRSVAGVSIPGNEMMVNGSVSVTSSTRLLGRAYDRSTWVLGRPRATQADGGSAAVEYVRERMRFELGADYRQSRVVRTTVTRVGKAAMSVARGRLSVSGAAEIGEIDDGRRTRRTGAFRGDIAFTHQRGSLAIDASRDDYGDGVPRLNIGIAGAIKAGRFEWRAGGEKASGDLYGAGSRVWTGIVLPVARQLTVLAGVEHTRSYDAMLFGEPSLAMEGAPKGTWRATFAVRRQVSIRVPSAGTRQAQ
jgi:hypothetical protein